MINLAPEVWSLWSRWGRCGGDTMAGAKEGSVRVVGQGGGEK